jgi:phage shock protein C
MQSYGVCEWWARKLGINSTQVRLGFIYFSFIALGSPIVIYLIMAWILDHKHYFQLKAKRKKSIWEL